SRDQRRAHGNGGVGRRPKLRHAAVFRRRAVVRRAGDGHQRVHNLRSMPPMMNRRIQRRSRRAFSLIELMIAIAMMLLLMLGISRVFRSASDAVGATNQILTSMRDGRSARSVLHQDFSSAVTDN